MAGIQRHPEVHGHVIHYFHNWDVRSYNIALESAEGKIGGTVVLSYQNDSWRMCIRQSHWQSNVRFFLSGLIGRKVVLSCCWLVLHVFRQVFNEMKSLNGEDSVDRCIHMCA
eukprot:11314248-Karenia_brevis.AAC.1